MLQKPIQRSSLRRYLGKEFFIIKRKLTWNFERVKWAKQERYEIANKLIFKHQSLIRRPLKDVDMYLQENKRTNLQLAIKKLNGVTLKPGETLSFWRLVGRPCKGKGYLEGLVLHQGQITKGIGGGLCQLGNLLFWMAAHSPLTITERHRHSFDVFPDINRSVPFGAGATLAYNYIDFQLRNETMNTFQIRLWIDEHYLHGELLSNESISSRFEIQEREHIIQQESWGAYSRHNLIIKLEHTPSGEVIETKLVENHALMMYSPLLDQCK
jgi:vancomycin resistance protein VanW